jgi:hypothetical protein
MRAARVSAVVIALLLGVPCAGATASPWSPVTGSTGIINQIGKVRAPDGTLHVVWSRATPGSAAGTSDIVHAAITSAGVVGPPTVIASAFASAGNPAIVNLPGGGLEAFFGGIQCITTGCPEGLFASTSTDGGASWTAPASQLDRDQAYASDLNATTLSDGTPFQTWWHTLGVSVHMGLSPNAGDYDYQAALGAGCCGYYSNLAADAFGHLQIAWNSNATGYVGTWSQAVNPLSGAPSGPAALMPGSVTNYNGSPQNAQMLTRTPIVALPGQSGQFYVAYPGGYPTTSQVLLWRVGDSTSTPVVSEPVDHNEVSVAADPAGPLWVFWVSSASGSLHVFARRLGPSGLEAPIDMGAPQGASSIYALDGDVSPAGDPEALALTRLASGATGTYWARGPQVAPPVLGQAVDAAVVSGTVLVKLPPGAKASAALVKGSGFMPLTQARQIPVGSQIDARRGVLRLVTASTRAGITFSGDFDGAVFSVAQGKSRSALGLTTLSLLDGVAGAPSYRACARIGKNEDAAVARARPRVLQQLQATASGRFRTSGRFASATVRGTAWGTLDQCDGTLTIVRRGAVLVTDFTQHNKTILVRAGHSYLAKAR